MALPEFVHGGMRILGESYAGVESVVLVPDLNLAFDFGRSPRELVPIDNVFLSHGHMDHAAGLAYYCAQRFFMDMTPGSVFVPHELLGACRELLGVWAKIDGNEPPARLMPARAGEDISVRRNLIVRPFAVNHPCRRRNGPTVQSLGYAAVEVRQKIRPEYAELNSQQIVELKRQGVEITRRIEMPLIAYCGDSAPGEFFALPHVRDASVLVMECTFLEPEHLDRAQAGGHTHVSQLPAILRELRNERILLTHLSRRTAIRDAKRLLRTAIGDELGTRVFLLMEGRRRRPQSVIPGASGSAPTQGGDPDAAREADAETDD